MLRKMAAYSILLATLIIAIMFAIANPKFVSWENFCTIFKHGAILSIISIGLTIVMTAGEIDFSYGGTIGLVGALFAGMLKKGYPPGVTFPVLLILSTFFGFLNGILTSYVKLLSFMTTVATMFIAMGLERAYSSGLTCWITNEKLLSIVRGNILGFPNLGWIALIVFLIFFAMVQFSRVGYYFRAIGGNKKAAIEVGINISRYKTIAFMLAGFLYGLAGLLEPLRVSGAIAYSGQNYLLPALTSVFLGTTMFFPGQYNIPGTFVGAFIMVMLMNGLTLSGVPFYFTPLLQGILLVVAVVIASDRRIKQIKF